MKFLSLTLTLLLFSLTTPGYGQTQPPEDYPCAPGEFPDNNPTSALLGVIVRVDGQNVDVNNDLGLVLDDDGFLVGRNQLFEDGSCGDVRTILSVEVYSSDNGVCEAGWGADDGENVTVVIRHGPNYYQVPGTFNYPADDGLFDPVGGDPTYCQIVNLDADDLIFGPALPVTFFNFRGRARDGSTHLSWQTAREENVDRFEVQRSPDGEIWEQVGVVGAVGFSTDLQSYRFTDPKVPTGRMLYRLKSVDLDDSFEYSAIVTVHIDATGAPTARIFPNPVAASALLSIELGGAWREEVPVTGTLISTTGRVVADYRNLEPGTTAVGLPPGIASGVYLLRLQQGSEVRTKRISIR